MTDRPELVVIENGGRKDVVELLERLLERAKQGELHSVALAGVMQESRIMTAFQTASDGDKFALLGAVSHVEHRLNLALDQLDEPVEVRRGPG